MAMSRSLGCRWVTSRPPIEMVPAVTSSSPAIMRSRVDLPHPDGPTSTSSSPSATSRSTSSTAATRPSYDLVAPRMAMSATGGPPGVGGDRAGEQSGDGLAAGARRTVGGDAGGTPRRRGAGRGGPPHVDDHRIGAGGEQRLEQGGPGGPPLGGADDDHHGTAGRRCERRGHGVAVGALGEAFGGGRGVEAPERQADAPRHEPGGDVGGALELG